MANRLGNNPLFDTSETPEFDAEKERKALGIEVPQEGTKKRGRPKKDGLVRNNAAQEGLPEDWTRAISATTISIPRALLKIMR